jgi:superfamily II DNA or RNA helicase
MKTLYPKQKEAAAFFINTLATGRNTLDTSDVGTGKTIVAAYVARALERPVAVLCPKAVIPSWQRELAEFGIEPVFVLNYEKIRTGNTPYMSKRGKKSMKWNLPEHTMVFIDECHKCKGPYTINAQLLISLVAQKFNVHMMSATASQDPTEMRAIGYALGLHNLNSSKPPYPNWYGWMKQYGCIQNMWNQWELKNASKLRVLHKNMYGVVAKRLTVSDFPDSFKENRVIVEPVNFSNRAKIVKAYDELGITPAIVEDLIENGTVEDSEYVLVNLLRARQLAEAFKVKDIAEMAKDLVDQNKSVVIFVNFRDTLEALREELKCGGIYGDQDSDERQQAIDSFQEDKEHILVVNIAAGGTGISLHDINGKRNRVSLISPSFSAKDHLQALGRIHRNGAKSDALQKILVACDSIEEKVIESIEKKLANLGKLHYS